MAPSVSLVCCILFWFKLNLIKISLNLWISWNLHAIIQVSFIYKCYNLTMIFCYVKCFECGNKADEGGWKMAGVLSRGGVGVITACGTTGIYGTRMVILKKKCVRNGNIIQYRISLQCRQMICHRLENWLNLICKWICKLFFKSNFHALIVFQVAYVIVHYERSTF